MLGVNQWLYSLPTNNRPPWCICPAAGVSHPQGLRAVRLSFLPSIGSGNPQQPSCKTGCRAAGRAGLMLRLPGLYDLCQEMPGRGH